MNGKYTVISTFAGCGGSSPGYQLAGFKELLAIDFDEHAVKVFKLNFDVSIWQRDIKTITGQEILDFCKIKKGELDVFDGSPPCQGFSTSGKRIVNDKRNELVFEYIRLVNELQPKVFVMENVSGMVKGRMKGLFIEIMKEFKKLNYDVKAKLMNAKYYNVPQSRQRLIFIGVRKDLKIEPSFPEPNKKIITVKEALKNVVPSPVPKFNDRYAKLWPFLKPGQNASYILKKGFNNCVKINPNKPAPTLPKTQTGRGFATIAHWDEQRALSINEAKRLCSFPDNFKLIGTYSEQWARLGNSVPPNFMKAIAENIRINILDKIK